MPLNKIEAREIVIPIAKQLFVNTFSQYPHRTQSNIRELASNCILAAEIWTETQQKYAAECEESNTP